MMGVDCIEREECTVMLCPCFSMNDCLLRKFASVSFPSP